LVSSPIKRTLSFSYDHLFGLIGEESKGMESVIPDQLMVNSRIQMNEKYLVDGIFLLKTVLTSTNTLSLSHNRLSTITDYNFVIVDRLLGRESVLLVV